MDYLGQIFGEYRLISRLGGGGFGDVYLGEHVRNRTRAAVKILHARLSAAGELKAFINEARAIRLKHPNIVSLLDFGIGVNDIPFLVMEYAPHGTLRTLHPKDTRLPLATIMTYVHPLASALQYAHNARVVHRDVKPENMLIGVDNHILLSDFGLATASLHTYSSRGQENISGTVPYMAPEQLEGKSRPASDQYALAIVVYEWLSGELPFQGTMTEIALQHRLADPPSLREKVPSLSLEVEQVVQTALAKDPRQRFANVEAFATALGAADQVGRGLAVFSANETATSMMSTDVVFEPQAVDTAGADKLGQSKLAVPAVAQTLLPAPPKSKDVHAALGKRKIMIVAGLALTSLVIAFLVMRSANSGAQPGVSHVPVSATSTKISSQTAVPSSAVTPTATPVSPTATPVAMQTPTVQVPVQNPTSGTSSNTAPTAIPQPPGVGSIRIDSGGFGDGSFVSDEDFSDTTPGRPSITSNNASSVIDTSGVSNPAPQSVYQSARVGDCLYTISHLTPNASYDVRLHFAENYWTQPGKRILNVTLNGQVVLSNFDIFATAGAANKAVVEQFGAHADGTGTITIQFISVEDNAQINAIEILAA